MGKNLGVWKPIGSELKIPARPFLFLTDEVIKTAEEILADHLVKDT
jgi:phage gpG-like protein